MVLQGVGTGVGMGVGGGGGRSERSIYMVLWREGF